MSSQLSSAARVRLARGPLANVDGEEAARAVQARLNGVADVDPLATTLYLDGQLALADDMLHYFDRTSMAHSLEVRVPFLDHEFVELSATIPTALKVRRGTTKYLLKKAAGGLIPPEIIDKPKIGFFDSRGHSVAGWFSAQVDGAIGDYLLSSDARSADFLDQSEVRALVQEQLDSRSRERTRLVLSILMLEVWLREYLPRALATEPEVDRLVLT
jgi:asparagine synthase (glutamine-hydrolysing)